MKPEFLLGKIAVAFTQPDQVRHGLTNPKAERIVGAVTACKDLPDAQPGGIPNKLLTIRGQSGRTMEVDMVRHGVQTYETWEEAKGAIC